LAQRVERIVFKVDWDTSGAAKGAGNFKKATDGVLGGIQKMTQGLGGFAAMAGPAFAIVAAKKFLDVLKEIGARYVNQLQLIFASRGIDHKVNIKLWKRKGNI